MVTWLVNILVETGSHFLIDLASTLGLFGFPYSFTGSGVVILEHLDQDLYDTGM